MHTPQNHDKHGRIVKRAVRVVPAQAKSVDIQEQEFSDNSIWISEQDLEDEYVKALDESLLWETMQRSGVFSRNELNNVKHSGENGSPTKHDIATFLRSKSKYKTQGAIMVAGLLDEPSASRIKSIMDLLNDIKSA